MPKRDEGGVSLRRDGAGPIWRALQGGGDLPQYPATPPRGSDRADTERSVRRAADLSGQPRRLGRKEGARIAASLCVIGEQVAEAKVRHLDETGFRIAGKLQWLHTTSSQAFTFYRAGEKRGAIPQDLRGGVVVHDHFLPYRRLDEVDHAFCNAHILRELQCLIEFDNEPWAERMRDMLLDANAAVNKAREAGAEALAAPVNAAFVDRYWAAVRLGLAFHRELPKLATKAAQPCGNTGPATICSKG